MYQILFFVFKWIMYLCPLYFLSGNLDIWYMSIMMVLSMKLLTVILKHMSRT